jgi:threonine dehydratase
MTGAVTATARCGAVLSGGNIDPLVLTHVMNHGLRAAGRYLVIRAVIPIGPAG